MRSNVSLILSVALLAGGCFGSDCLPEPAQDASPARIRVVVDYESFAGGRQTAEHLSGQPARTIDADSHGPVIVIFEASDSSGVRTLSPGMTLQQTVGIGVERRYLKVDPVESNCPRPELSYRHEIHGTSTPQSLNVTAVAVNWTGLTASLEPLTIRLKEPSD